MIRKLRIDYPQAKIFATFGAMLAGDAYAAARSSIFGAVESIRKDGDPGVSFIEFSPPRSGRRYGCDWHPGLDAHRSMATRLETAIQKELGWTAQTRESSPKQGDALLVWNGAGDDTLVGGPSTFSADGSFH
jgi:hypothetical protein